MKILVGELPVGQIPPSIEVLRSCIAVVDVVGVLPHIAGDQWDVFLGLADDAVGIMGVHNLYLFGLLVENQPRPSTGEVGGCLGAEFLLEVLKGAIAGHNAILHSTIGFTPAIGRQAVPVEGVVPDLSSIVEEGSWSCCLNDLLEGFVLFGLSFHKVIEVGHVGLVMGTMVEVEGLLRDMWGKSIFSKGKVGQYERH